MPQEHIDRVNARDRAWVVKSPTERPLDMTAVAMAGGIYHLNDVKQLRAWLDPQFYPQVPHPPPPMAESA